MSPCAGHCTYNDLPKLLSEEQINMNVKQEYQDQPLDLSTKLKQQTDTSYEVLEDTVNKIKKETFYDSKHSSEVLPTFREYRVLSPTVYQRKQSNYARSQIVTQAKHKNLPSSVQGYSRAQNHVVRKHATQRIPQHKPEVHKAGDLVNRERLGQYVSFGLSGGTCKVVSQARDQEVFTPSWEMMAPSCLCPKDLNQIPTVVSDFNVVPNHHGSRQTPNVPNTRPRPNSQNGGQSRNYDNQILRNVNDLVRRRNELLAKTKFNNLHAAGGKSYEQQNNMSKRVVSSPLLSNFQLNLSCETPAGGDTEASDTALTVQPRGLCGGTMVSCEPSAESMVAAINPPLSIYNIHMSNLSFTTNFNVSPFNGEGESGSYFSSREIGNVLKEKPAACKEQYRGSQMVTDVKEFPIKEEYKKLNLHDFSKQDKSRPTKGVQDMNSSNLTLLSDVCLLLKDKEITHVKEENDHGNLLKSLLRSGSTENDLDLPLKKRKL